MAPVFLFYRTRPLSYRAAVLEQLNERLGGRLVVCAGQPPAASSVRTIMSEQEHHFDEIALRNWWLYGEKVHAQFFWNAFAQHRPAALIVEESPRSITLPALLAYARWHRIPVVMWGHFSSNDRAFRPASSWMDRYRLWLARQGDACVCYTDAIADLLRPYLPEERLFVARNTLDTTALFALYDQLDAEGRTSVRQRLSLPTDEPILVFIGRLVADKGTDMLLDVFTHLREQRPMRLLVIGDGPERDVMERRVRREGLSDVRFLGAMKEWAASAPFLYAADVMLQPSHLGLSVNHAFAFGLPVVSQAPPVGDGRHHGPEWSYVQHGENGMLTPPGNVDAMVQGVNHVLEHHTRISAHALTYAREHLTAHHMLDGLEAAVRHAEGQHDR